MHRREILIAALHAAAIEILKHDPSSVRTDIKSTAGDFVTAADIASERSIINTIRTTFPDDLVISEETTAGHEMLNQTDLAQLTAWVIDPIDGTNNFKRGMTYSCISIGYIHAGEIVLAGILDPYHDALYMAEPGAGATRNGVPLGVASKVSFDPDTRVATGNSYKLGGTQASLDCYQKLGHVWVDVLGSGALMMVDIAAGKLDLLFHNSLQPWDNAAGFLIAQEAGAKIVGLQGQPVTWLSAAVVMGNPTLVDLFIEKITATA